MPAVTPDASLAPGFEAILHAIAMSDGFALYPVQMAGPDIAKMLAKWLAAKGWRPRVIEPVDDAGWRGIVASLVEEQDDESAVVIVIGPRRPPPGIYAGLRLLNQRRDTIVDELGCPLLWCGPPEMMALMWERAPDFWSIRAMTHRLEVPTAAPAEMPLWAGVVVRDAPERLREMRQTAREQNDPLVSVRVAIQLAEALLACGEFEEAAELSDELRREPAGTTVQRGTLELIRARANLAVGRTAEAAEAIAAAEALAQSGVDGAFAAMLGTAKGNLALRSDLDAAVAAYEPAHLAFRGASDKRNEAVVIADLGVAALAAGDAERAIEHLELARTMLRDVGDDRSESRVVAHLGRAHAALRDSRSANEYFDEALEMTRAIGDRRGESRILSHLAQVYLNVGDPEKALEDATRALAIAEDVGDARLIARAKELVLAAKS
jgi:tetratricopeptide (TPR) repeat protein